MARKTESQFPFLHPHGSHSCTKNGSSGSHSCTSPSALLGTICYISGGFRTTSALPNVNGQPAEVVQFPLWRQLSKVRDVALKLSKTRTDRHADYYQSQVCGALQKRLARRGLSVDQQHNEITKFWHAVILEAAKISRQVGAK